VRARALLIALLAPALAWAQADEDRLVVVHAKSVITVSGETFTPGSIVIRNGVIEAVGKRVDVPVQARVVDARDQVVMPTLVSPRTRFGLGGYSRRGNKASRSAADELLIRPGHFDPLVAAGFGVAGVIPDGSGIPGAAAAIRLPGAEVLGGPGYLRVTLRSLPRDKATLRDALAQAKQAIEKEAKARAEWEKKHGGAPKAAAKGGKPGAAPSRRGRSPSAPLAAGAPVSDLAETAPVDTKTKPTFQPPEIPGDLTPFVKLLRKAKDAPRLLVEISAATQLLHVREVCERFEVQPFAYLLANGSESDLFHAIEALGEAKARVLVYPQISNEPYTLTRRNLPAELVKAGATVAFAPLRDDREGHEGLLEALALLHRDGLERDAALAGVTLHAAALLGQEASLGTLEPGKRADLLLLDGDPLAPGTRAAQVILAGETAWTRE
jgi:hypothetical protein